MKDSPSLDIATNGCPGVSSAPGLSDFYYTALRESQHFHEKYPGYFTGSLIWRHAREIKWQIRDSRSTSLLDYGCGKGVQWNGPMPNRKVKLCNYLKVPCHAVQLFDPAWPPFAGEPAPADIVIATHALGSIPITDLPVIVERIYALARRAVYVGEKLTENVKKRVFTDLSLHPVGWSTAQWAALLAQKRPARLDVRLGVLTHRARRLKVVRI